MFSGSKLLLSACNMETFQGCFKACRIYVHYVDRIRGIAVVNNAAIWFFASRRRRWIRNSAAREDLVNKSGSRAAKRGTGLRGKMHYRGGLLLSPFLSLSRSSSLFHLPSFLLPSSLPLTMSFFLRSISYRFPLPFGGKNGWPLVHGDALPATSL